MASAQMRHEAGNTSMRVRAGHLLAAQRRAAAISRSSRRPLVQEPMTTWSTLTPPPRPPGTTLSTVCGLATCGSSRVTSISMIFS